MQTKQFFTKYRNAEVLHFTMDNLAFVSEAEALRHAHTLEDDTVIPISRAVTRAAMKDMGIEDCEEFPLESIAA